MCLALRLAPQQLHVYMCNAVCKMKPTREVLLEVRALPLQSACLAKRSHAAGQALRLPARAAPTGVLSVLLMRTGRACAGAPALSTF